MIQQTTDAGLLCDYCQASPRAPQTPGQRQSAFCSVGCRQQARKRRLGQTKPPPTNCAHCQGQLPPRAPHRPGRHQVYCNDVCEDAAYLLRLRERKPENFTPRSPPGGSVQPGMRFGKLVISECFDRRARVECDCGTSKIVVKHNILAGDTVSCGCVRRGILLEARARRQLRGELFAAMQGGLVRRGARTKEDRRLGVCAILPNADEDDSPVCYLVSTRDKDTEHSNFDEARVEYLLRTGRMSA